MKIYPRIGTILGGTTMILLFLAGLAAEVSGQPVGRFDRPSVTTRPSPQKEDSRSVPPFGDLVYIPTGRFMMGSSQEEVERAWKECVARFPECDRAIFEAEYPEHLVYLKAYYIDRFNITNKQYKECVLDDECRPPHRVNIITDPKYDDYPVVFVDWSQAQNYCDWAGGRLPTEAEWEKAARGIDEFIYPWGDQMSDRAAVWNVKAPKPVTERVEGQSSFGLYDMAGNVWDWVSDWFDPNYYEVSPYYNPQGPENGIHKVFRGGSWASDLAVYLRTMTRNHNKPNTWNPFIGIRCAKDVVD